MLDLSTPDLVMTHHGDDWHQETTVSPTWISEALLVTALQFARCTEMQSPRCPRPNLRRARQSSLKGFKIITLATPGRLHRVSSRSDRVLFLWFIVLRGYLYDIVGSASSKSVDTMPTA